MIVQQSSNWHKLIHWRSKGTSRTGDHCSFVSSFPLEQRQIKATRRKRRRQKTAQMARYGHKPKSPAISTHERCDDTRETSYVLYTIVRLVEMPRLIDIQYSTWQLASGLSSSLELHCAARPLQKSTCTVYAISRFKVLFRNVHCGIDPGFCRWFYAFDPRSQASDPRSHPFDPWSHIPRYDSVIIF